MRADLDLTVKLQAQEWNTVMEAMAERPYREVASVIHLIRTQCMAQAEAADAAEADQTAQVQQFPRAVNPDIPA